MSTNLDEEKIDLSEWISQSEAARMRGVSRQAISKLIRKGRVRTIIAGGHVLVNRQDIEKFEPQEAGRPRAKADDRD